MSNLGYTKKEIVQAISVSNVRDLIAALTEIGYLAGMPESTEAIYVEDGRGESLTVRLIENTLTDGSKTYDVRIS